MEEEVCSQFCNLIGQEDPLLKDRINTNYHLKVKSKMEYFKFHPWIWTCLSILMLRVETGTVDKMFIKDGVIPIKGGDLQIVCEVSQFTSSNVLTIYRLENIPDQIAGQSALTDCSATACFTNIDRLTFTPRSTSVTVSIFNLNRTEDQKWWICTIGTSRKELKITVYSVPQTLQLDSPPNQDQDLAENAVTLRCSTGCTYPQPSFKWFYTEFGGSRQEWSTLGSDTDKTGGCADSEKIYTSTLSLAKYSTFPGNLDKTVKFTCGIPTFTGMAQPLYTKPSVNILFAVQVSSITLKDGDRIPSETLIVEGGVSKTLTCTTSVSRPTPTVVWYIGTVERQRSSSNSTFTFIPEDSDTSKQIFCKAFNMQSESRAIVSIKATLNVLDTSIAQTFYIEGHLGQTNVTVDEHDADIQFKCIVNSHPKFDIKLMFEGDVLQEQFNDSSLSFTRHDVSCFDAGVYTCQGRTVYGRKSTENITVFVQCSPRPFRQVERNITSHLYSTVTLGVTVIAYPEPGTKGFAWYKEESIGWFPMLSNADLKITSSGLQSNLKLLNVSKEDYGHYKAIVTNTIGTYEQHIFLLEETVSGVQKADSKCSCQTSDKATALIVGLTVGVVCCIVIMYAAYVTRKNRLLREGTKPLDSSGKQVTCANPTFASDVTERGDASIQQYTDLSRYANPDSSTYDLINKI